MFESVLGEAPRKFVSFKYAQAFFNKVADGKSIYILQVTNLNVHPHTQSFIYLFSPFLLFFFFIFMEYKMDYPLHYTESNLQENVGGANHTQSNYRSYGVFSNPAILFDNNNTSSSPTLEANEDRTRSLMLMSTRPPQVMHDPWSQHQLLNTSDFNPNDMHNLHHHISHSERGIAGFVSKLYQ